MTQTGSLIVVSGFSGVGKGTVMNALLDRHTGYALSVSATTRAPREGEVHGKSYFFVTKEEFEELIGQNGLIEHACYCGNYYGTPRSFVEQQLQAGIDVLLEIEIQGARKIKLQYPEALLIFIMPPSADELIKRLTGRGSEKPEVIHERMMRAVQESEGIEDYDYIFVNDTVDDCADAIDALIKSNHHKTTHNMKFIETIRTQIQTFEKGE